VPQSFGPQKSLIIQHGWVRIGQGSFPFCNNATMSCRRLWLHRFTGYGSGAGFLFGYRGTVHTIGFTESGGRVGIVRLGFSCLRFTPRCCCCCHSDAADAWHLDREDGTRRSKYMILFLQTRPFFERGMLVATIHVLQQLDSVIYRQLSYFFAWLES